MNNINPNYKKINGVDIDEIRNIPILDIAQRLGIEINKSNKALCFKHSEKDGSLSFNIKKNYFYCFGCRIGGGGIELVKLHQNLEFKEAIQWFKAKFSITQSPKNNKTSIIKSTKQNFHNIYSKFLSILNDLSSDHYLIKERYLDNSLLADNFIKLINSNFTNINQFNEKDLTDSGLFSISKNNKIYFTFWNCNAIIPFFKNNQIIYLQGIADRKQYKGKYINLPNITKPLFYLPKTFPYTIDGKECNDFYVTEGIIDCLTLLTCGYNAIALIDCNLNDEKIKECLEFGKGFMWNILGDSDLVGLKAKLQLSHFLNQHNIQNKVLALPKFNNKVVKDINELHILHIKNNTSWRF
jgi:DNA primase